MNTFLVQVWVPADEASTQIALRGVVRHVATGHESTFRGEAEVLHLLRQAAGDTPLEAEPNPT